MIYNSYLLDLILSQPQDHDQEVTIWYRLVGVLTPVDYNISEMSQHVRRGAEWRGLGVFVVTSDRQIECSSVESLLLSTYMHLGIVYGDILPRAREFLSWCCIYFRLSLSFFWWDSICMCMCVYHVFSPMSSFYLCWSFPALYLSCLNFVSNYNGSKVSFRLQLVCENQGRHKEGGVMELWKRW